MASEAGTIVETRKISPIWPMESNVPAVFANQFAYSILGDDVVISFGSYLPTGLQRRAEEEISEFLDKSEISQVAKIVMSRDGLKKLLALLEGAVEVEEESEDDE
jgi:hypothetical protein